MLFSQALRYNDVIPQNTVANATSIPVFCADSREIFFTIRVSANANFTINALISNQELPPDPTVATSNTNLYSTVAYQDLDTEVTYNTGNLYNPTAPGSITTKTFAIQTNGARWIFIQLTGYSAGTLLKTDVDNFTAN